MSLRRRGSVWWIDFTAPSGERVRSSARTEDKAQALELHDRLKSEAWRVSQLGEKQQRTWDEAALRWLKETEHKTTHLEDVRMIAWLQQHLRGRYLSEITRESIARIGETKRQEASPSRANRYLGLIRSILRRAALDWEWIERPPRIRLYPEPKRRVRWLTPEQAKSLASRYGLNVLIVDAQQRFDLPVLYRNRDFVIYRLS